MIIPVRCYTCGKLLSNKEKTYKTIVYRKKLALKKYVNDGIERPTSFYKALFIPEITSSRPYLLLQSVDSELLTVDSELLNRLDFSFPRNLEIIEKYK